MTYSAQYDSNGMLKKNWPDIIQRKKSDAVVVSAVLSDETPTLKTSIQISLSACKDSRKAYEMPGGGALRLVGLFSLFAAYLEVFLSAFAGFHRLHEEIWK